MDGYFEEKFDMNGPLGSGIIVCSACLCSGRDLYGISNMKELIEMFHLIMYDFGRKNETNVYVEELYVCWECQAMLERFHKFKWKVHRAQEYIQGKANGSITENLDHTYTTRCMSSLKVVHKTDYDKTYIDVSDGNSDQNILSFVSTQQLIPVQLKPALAPNMVFGLCFKPETIVGTNNTTAKTEVAIAPKIETPSPKAQVTNPKDYRDKSNTTPKKITLPPGQSGENIGSIPNIKVISNEPLKPIVEKIDTHYVTEIMTKEAMFKSRELWKQHPPYLNAPYKCMLCIIVLDSQELLEVHFINEHSAKPGQTACYICHKFVDNSDLSAHTDDHYLRYMCKHCAHVEYSVKLIRQHVKTHSQRCFQTIKSEIKRSGSVSSDVSEEFPTAGTKRTRDSYPCWECDMVFKMARKRRTHVDRYHREGIVCDNCKRRFVNKTTLIEHLRLFCPVLYPEPPPQEECPICHKMVRVVYLKGHIRRHNNKMTYECKECNKTYSDYINYTRHIKYSRAHATEFKYRCPMCEKGYSSKASMQDHFNYQHLGKTSHKCPVCDKPLATRRCVVQHVRRAHSNCNDRAQYICHHCGKTFKYERVLREHTTIHTGARPLECDVCGATFRHSATLRTHRRRLHELPALHDDPSPFYHDPASVHPDLVVVVDSAG